MGKESTTVFTSFQLMLPSLFSFSRQNSRDEVVSAKQSPVSKISQSERAKNQQSSLSKKRRVVSNSSCHHIEEARTSRKSSTSSEHSSHSSSSSQCFTVSGASTNDLMALQKLWRWVIVSIVVSSTAVLVCIGVTLSTMAGGRSEETAKWMLNALIDPRQISSATSASSIGDSKSAKTC